MKLYDSRKVYINKRHFTISREKDRRTPVRQFISSIRVDRNSSTKHCGPYLVAPLDISSFTDYTINTIVTAVAAEIVLLLLTVPRESVAVEKAVCFSLVSPRRHHRSASHHHQQHSFQAILFWLVVSTKWTNQQTYLPCSRLQLKSFVAYPYLSYAKFEWLV